MRAALVLVMAASAACKFEPGTLGGGSAIDDAPTDTGDAVVDGPPDVPIDARACPVAPSGCTRFTCASSSSCYYVCGTSTTGKLNYNAAVMACETLAVGCIVTINDQLENDCIRDATSPVFTSSMVWIGWEQASNGAEPAGGWDWQCPPSTFVAPNWGDPTGEPTDTDGEDCATMIEGGAWIDAECSGTARYVCELP